MLAKTDLRRALRLTLQSWAFRLALGAAAFVSAGFALRVPAAHRAEASIELFVVAQNACAILQVVVACTLTAAGALRNATSWTAATRGVTRDELRRAHDLAGVLGACFVGAAPLLLVAVPSLLWPGASVLVGLRVLASGIWFTVVAALAASAMTTFFATWLRRDGAREAVAWTTTLLLVPEILRVLLGGAWLAWLPLGSANRVRWAIAEGAFNGSAWHDVLALFVAALWSVGPWLAARALSARRARREPHDVSEVLA